MTLYVEKIRAPVLGPRYNNKLGKFSSLLAPNDKRLPHREQKDEEKGKGGRNYDNAS
jgi:hypothetical protein